MYGLSVFKIFLEQFVTPVRRCECATSPKVADSIPDMVLGIFLSLKTSGCTMDCGVNQSTTDMHYFLRGEDGRCVGLTTLPPPCAEYLEILGTSTSWNPKGLSRPVMG